MSSPWEEAAARDARPPPPEPRRWFDGDVSELAARAMGGPEPCVVRRPLRDGQVEDWALVEPPAVPTPSATDDDVSAWGQSVCAPRAATPPRADVEVEVEAPPVDVATPGWWTRREWQL